MLRTALLLSAVLAGANTASAQDPRPASAGQPAAKAASSEPTSVIRPGTYDLEIMVGGGVIDGTLALTAVGDSLDAKLRVGEHDPPIQTVVRHGSRLTLSGKATGVDVVYELQFSGDTLLGKFTFNGDGGAVTGKRRK